MSELEPPPRRRPARRRAWPGRVAVVVAIAIAFAIGVALGRALEDGPPPAGTRTSVRTLEPLPQQPATP